jgi:hypothetical protein
MRMGGYATYAEINEIMVQTLPVAPDKPDLLYLKKHALEKS